MQTERNKDWKFNVQFSATDDTPLPPDYDKFTLFHSEEQDMFMPCMVGTLESQFLKRMCQIKNARKCLDIGTFTGMSALAMAEGMGDLGTVIPLEIAQLAQQGFNECKVGNRLSARRTRR